MDTTIEPTYDFGLLHTDLNKCYARLSFFNESVNTVPPVRSICAMHNIQEEV